MWIFVAAVQKFSHYNFYSNKILKLKQENLDDQFGSFIIYRIESINGLYASPPDWFYDDDLADMNFIEVEESTLKLLAFL